MVASMLPIGRVRETILDPVVSESGGWRATVHTTIHTMGYVQTVFRVEDSDGYAWCDAFSMRTDDHDVETWVAWSRKRCRLLLDGFQSGLPDPAEPPTGPWQEPSRRFDDMEYDAVVPRSTLNPAADAENTGSLVYAYDPRRSLRLPAMHRDNGCTILPGTRSVARALVAAHPWTLDLHYFPTLVDELLRLGLRGDCRRRDLASVFRGIAYPDGGLSLTTAPVVACLDRHHRRSVAIGPDPVMMVLEAVPASWLPRTDEDYALVVRMARLLYTSSFVSDPKSLARVFSGVRGDWSGYVADLEARTAGTGGLERTVRDMGDMADDVLRNLVRPATTLRGMDEVDVDVLRDTAGRIAFGGTEMRQALERSRIWHRKAGTLPGLRDTEGGWGVLADRFVSGSGVSIEFLTSKERLEEEGRQMAHCVVAFADKCRDGKADVASIRDGSGVRLSTVEIRHRDGSPPDVVQHRSFANDAPPAEAVAALAEWEDAVGEGRIQIGRGRGEEDDAEMRRLRTSIRISERGSPADWKGILPERFVRMSWSELLVAVEEIYGDIRRNCEEDADWLR